MKIEQSHSRHYSSGVCIEAVAARVCSSWRVVSGTREERVNLLGIEQRETCLLDMCQVFFEKENVKSVRNMVFTSQRNTTQKCRLIFEN